MVANNVKHCLRLAALVIVNDRGIVNNRFQRHFLNIVSSDLTCQSPSDANNTNAAKGVRANDAH